jgi:hypothetical protein
MNETKPKDLVTMVVDAYQALGRVRHALDLGGHGAASIAEWTTPIDAVLKRVMERSFVLGATADFCMKDAMYRAVNSAEFWGADRVARLTRSEMIAIYSDPLFQRLDQRLPDGADGPGEGYIGRLNFGVDASGVSFFVAPE